MNEANEEHRNLRSIRTGVSTAEAERSDRATFGGTLGVRLRQDSGVATALIRRDLIHLVRERTRWLGILFQPILFWVILGTGLSRSFQSDGVAYIEYFFPGMLVMTLLFTGIFSMISVIEDRRSGFLQAIVAGPGSRAAIALGKIGGASLLALIQVTLLLLFCPLAGFPWAEIAWPSLVLALVLSAFLLASVNFTMAWLIDSTQGFHAVMSVILLPLWVLSGAMFPPAGTWLDGFTRVNPLTYAVMTIRTSLRGEDLSVAELSPGFFLILLTVIALLIASWTVGRGNARP